MLAEGSCILETFATCLEGMTLGSDEVEGDGMILLAAISVAGDSSTWVTPTMGTWGGKTIVDDVVANGVVAEQTIWKIEVCIRAGIWWPSSECLRC